MKWFSVASPGPAGEFSFTFASGDYTLGNKNTGGTPRPPLTEMEDLRATVTDALQSITFRLYSSAAAPDDRGDRCTETPTASVPRYKVQDRHVRYSEIRNP